MVETRRLVLQGSWQPGKMGTVINVDRHMHSAPDQAAVLMKLAAVMLLQAAAAGAHVAAVTVTAAGMAVGVASGTAGLQAPPAAPCWAELDQKPQEGTPAAGGLGAEV